MARTQETFIFYLQNATMSSSIPCDSFFCRRVGTQFFFNLKNSSEVSHDFILEKLIKLGPNGFNCETHLIVRLKLREYGLKNKLNEFRFDIR